MQGVTYGDLASRMSEIGRNVMCLCIFTSPGAWPVGKKPHFQVLSSDGGPSAPRSETGMVTTPARFVGPLHNTTKSNTMLWLFSQTKSVRQLRCLFATEIVSGSSSCGDATHPTT